MDKDWIYYGVFFSQQMKNFLIERAKDIVDIPEDWTLYADHMTIVYNSGLEINELIADGLESLLNEQLSLHISSIGVSDEAIAFGIDNYKTQNEHSHITIAVAPGSKPVKSNNITNWMPIEGFYVNGKFGKR